MKKFILTISREFGSGGRLIGSKVAERFGVPFYDRELIEMAAEKSGLSPDFIARSDERATSSFAIGMGANSAMNLDAGYFMQYEVPVSDRAYYAQAAVITELAAKESCVIVGRSAGYILRDHPDVVRVLVVAPIDDRIERAVNDYGLPRKGLTDKIIKADKSRAGFYRRYTGENWLDARGYDLCINTGKLGIDNGVEAVSELLKHR
jgi:cytidylate kinase